MKVVTFGEIMLRLQPENKLRFMQEKRFEATFGGSEANVAVCLANFNVSSEYITKLPNNDIGKACLNEVRSYGVKTDNICFGDGRMGIYFIEKGASVRPSKVIYDRAYSAMSLATEEDFDFDKIFEGADWLHFSGITPAISSGASKLTLQAVKKAKEKGLTVSCDFNYRANLWSKEECKKVMLKLLPYVDVLIGVGKFEANEILNVGGESFSEIAKNLKDKFGCKIVASNMRSSKSADENTIWAMMYDGKVYESKKYELNIVDRVGGGDSFVAGLIYGLINGKDSKTTLEIAIASSAIKHTIEGDFNKATIDEVLSLISGDISGSVKR